MKRSTAYLRALPWILVSLWAASAHAQGDAARGSELFQQNCAPCHSQERGQNLVGPSLFSVVGRPAASIADFSYSDAMKRSGIVWTVDRLMAYLKAPRKYVPGIKMLFPGLSDEKDRENLCAFLATLGQAAAGSRTTSDTQTPPSPPRASN
jgi:cytochrome c